MRTQSIKQQRTNREPLTIPCLLVVRFCPRETVRWVQRTTVHLRFGAGLYASSLELNGDSLDSLCDEGGVVGFLFDDVRSDGIDSFSIRTSAAKQGNIFIHRMAFLDSY